MSNFIMVTDSSCDLPAALAEEMGLVVLPLSVDIDGEIYRNYLDEREITFKDFYSRLRTATKVKTAAANRAEFLENTEPLAAAGNDILYIGFSSGLSSTYATGASALEELREKYPERKLYAVDSLSASLGQGLLLWHCWQKKKAGGTIEEVRDFAEENKLHLCHWFTVDDLMHLKRGGRISATTAIVGSMLSIKPVMHMDDEGHLINVRTARGRKASLRALADEVARLGLDNEHQQFFISHADCLADAEYLASLLRERFHNSTTVINMIGPVIGAHTGVGCVAMFFLGTQR